MRSTLLDARILSEIARVGESASDDDAQALVRYLTDLADLVDNELFGAMTRFGSLAQQELSVLGRGSYEESLVTRVGNQLKRLRPRPFGGTIQTITDRVKSTDNEIRSMEKQFRPDQGTEFLLAVKPNTQELVGQLLLAAELVGSG